MPEPADTGLVLGPILRRVTGSRATVWVQTAQPATVEVRTAAGAGGAGRTFTAYGRHYALVVVEGLRPAGVDEYRVLLDGEQVWPPPEYAYPAPAIHTRGDRDPVRLVYGSCRQANPHVTDKHPPDALDAYAVRLAKQIRAGGQAADWPDALVLLGDQVYADETSPAVRRWLSRRRDRRRPDAPSTQVVSFDEYTRLYLESWTDSDVRWLLSTVPSMMIFDDHEIIDDWNTSESWRRDQSAQSWWAERIAAGLSSYWVYQHLGNLPPDELGTDPVYSAVRAAEDATAVLAEFGARADSERGEYRWSYALDIGRTRIVMLDNRAGRDLEPGKRSMLPDHQWDWLVNTISGGDFDHLVIGSSLPWLLAPAVHHVEAMNEWLCDSPRRWVAGPSEKLRRALDLEHWAAFGRSFDALGVLLGQLGAGACAPATISVLSGDVHHSYAARAHLGGDVHSEVYQLTCSPVHNGLPAAIKMAARLGWTRGAGRFARGLAKLAGTPAPSVRWELTSGPFFGNAISTLIHRGREAYALIEGTDARARLNRRGAVRLHRRS
ncbi:alkaline phosphatase family protein [Planosporangium flavigriseum]|uniref:Alkaline phosphatase n=1 Tax=Planosporangium flavigriseum TaxID=373681 RepID=A0A8J3PKP1_9ACTN|nr:alkaline phosphatase D family protein [Planosporangium flavigriseum]NJC64140.1 alkaline phosphatase family protein [Planosporangium flavigriseum]GIG73022.1 alkaline phosphatase [Planosporangium flavigriseum]